MTDFRFYIDNQYQEAIEGSCDFSEFLAVIYGAFP